MVNRADLGIIRGARTGDMACQLALAKCYLFGGTSLPKSMLTALYWLQRAAQQDCADACLLIGAHIPAEIARQRMPSVRDCYERAYAAGVMQAGLVLAQLLPQAAQATQATQAQPVERGAADGADALLASAWDNGGQTAFLRRALPLASELLQRCARTGAAALAPHDALLLSRCAQLLSVMPDANGADGVPLLRLWECAAGAGERGAQLALGLLLARMDKQGRRLPPNGEEEGAPLRRGAHLKRAVRWLTLAGEQGLAEAWFALSRIYVKPEFSLRSVAQARSCLERAAAMGHCAAQLECGMQAWRKRREGVGQEVRAAGWLMQAAAQGCRAAEAALSKIAPERSVPARPPQRPELAQRHPFLAARLELAALFHLSRAEALLLDVHAADCGHCLVVDVRACYGRGRRRLVLLRSAEQRQALERIRRLFDGVDCSLAGPEGNYRQRLYRLKTCGAAWPAPQA